MNPMDGQDSKPSGVTTTASPHRALRVAMYGALVAIALLLGASSWMGLELEARRATDAELINLAGAQRMLAQRLALLATAPTLNRTSLANALLRSREEAPRVEALLGEVGSQVQALPTPLREALTDWQTQRIKLWSDVEERLRIQPPVTSLQARENRTEQTLRSDAESLLNATENLVSEIQMNADARSVTATHGLEWSGAVGGLLLLLIAVALIEPVARRVHRQHCWAESQNAELKRLALVAEHTRNVVCITDAERRLVWANAAFTRVTGYTLAESIGRKPGEFLQTPGTDRATVQRMRAAMDEGSGVHVELLNRSRSGREYWLDIDIQPLRDERGTLTGFIAVETDITSQIQAQLDLQALLDALPAGVVQQDVHGQIIAVNVAAERALGLTRDQLMGRAIMDPRWYVINEDLTPYTPGQMPIMRSVQEGARIRGETIGVMTPSDGQRWLLVNSEPLHDTNGVISSAVACFIDVTEQRTQRALLELAVQAAEIGTWEWQVTSNEHDWSDASCRMLGFGADEFSPLLPVWRERIHSDDIARLDGLLERHVLDPATPFRCEFRVRHRSGAWTWVQSFGTAVERDESGRGLRLVGVHIDITERKLHEERLQASVLTDALTGLPNRLGVSKTLQTAILRHAADTSRHFALLFMDFDRFKQVNDTLGHSSGDELLKQIALRLDDVLCMDDLLSPTANGAAGEATRLAGRLGGDEFVIVLDGLRRPDDAGLVADRVLMALAKPYYIEGQRVHTTASIGIVTSEHPFQSPDSLLRDADTAMYEAKRSGRARWVWFEPRMHEQAAQSAYVETDLHSALESDELFVVYQPIVLLNTDSEPARCIGIEALLRWKHPERGLIPPAQFIPVAEASGLIGQLGHYVLQTACRDFSVLRKTLGVRAPSYVAVNLSIAQLHQANLLEQISSALTEFALPPDSLQLEITESMAAQDAAVRLTLAELRKVGIRLALDDFGTGYSSLSCLHLLPINTVKIDRSFVIEAERSAYHRTLIEATLQVAASLDLVTVAEGIETQAQADLITSLGCGRGQGYLFSRPIDVSSLATWLTTASDLPGHQSRAETAPVESDAPKSRSGELESHLDMSAGKQSGAHAARGAALA